MTDTTTPAGTGTEAPTGGTGAEGVQGQAPADGAGKAHESELDLDAARQELARVRKEAARYRSERNELRPLAEKAREMEEASKTEAERTADRIASLEEENKKLALAKARDDAAAEAGVNPSLVHGDSPEELAAHAKAIKEEIDAAVKAAVPFAPTVPGENAGGPPSGETDWLRAQLNRR